MAEEQPLARPARFRSARTHEERPRSSGEWEGCQGAAVSTQEGPSKHVADFSVTSQQTSDSGEEQDWERVYFVQGRLDSPYKLIKLESPEEYVATTLVAK